jgi:hypothetical protein
MIGKLGLLSMPLSQYIIGDHQFLSQDMHKVILVYLFILCTQLSNGNLHIKCHLNTRKSLFNLVLN